MLIRNVGIYPQVHTTYYTEDQQRHLHQSENLRSRTERRYEGVALSQCRDQLDALLNMIMKIEVL